MIPMPCQMIQRLSKVLQKASENALLGLMLALVLISLWVALVIIAGLTIALILLGRIGTKE